MSATRNLQVIVLNGGSSSGKSSIARALQEILPGIWLSLGIDTFIDALPAKGDSPRAGITYKPDGTITFSPEFWSLENSWYRGVAAMAEAGARMILDEVFLSGSTGQERLRSIFTEAVVLWVGVHCAQKSPHPTKADGRTGRREWRASRL